MSRPVLCYVSDSFAFFTYRDLESQKGDDWDDAPYQHNADEPYDDDGNIVKIAFDGQLWSPADFSKSLCLSVRDINRGASDWLWTLDSTVRIPAGTTIPDFKALVRKAGGHVYVRSIEP